MDTIKIFEDDEITISVASFLLDYYDYFKKSRIKISPIDLQILLDISFSYGIEINELKNYEVISSSQIIPITKDGYVSVLEKYDIFNEALFFISEIYTEVENIQEIKESDLENMVKSLYEEEYNIECFVKIFDENEFGISGFIRIIQDKKIYTFFFKFLD